MAQCGFIKLGGVRCKATAMKGYDHCYGHRPDLAEERQRNASKGGRSGGRGRGEIADIKTLLSGLTRQVLAGEQQTGRAAVAAQLINTTLRALELERKIKETEELEARIEQLERAAEGQNGARWAR